MYVVSSLPLTLVSLEYMVFESVPHPIFVPVSHIALGCTDPIKAKYTYGEVYFICFYSLLLFY